LQWRSLQAAFKWCARRQSSGGISLHSKLDPVRSNKQELYPWSAAPAIMAALLRAATTNPYIAGEISVVSA
jgi:hypothetical protein